METDADRSSRRSGGRCGSLICRIAEASSAARALAIKPFGQCQERRVYMRGTWHPPTHRAQCVLTYVDPTKTPNQQSPGLQRGFACFES